MLSILNQLQWTLTAQGLSGIGKQGVAAARHFIDTLKIPESELPAISDVTPFHAVNLASLPPAFILAAGADPLKDEAEAYALKLTLAGISVDLYIAEDMVHDFLAFPIAQSVPSIDLAWDKICAVVRKAFTFSG